VTQEVIMNMIGNDYQNLRVLVTGMSGFKGAFLAYLLCLLGAKVIGTVGRRYPSESSYGLLGLDRIISEVRHLDVTDRESVRDLLNTVRPEVVFHLAAKSTVPECQGDPVRAFNVNVLGAVNSLDACRSFPDVQTVLMCSTDHVFGPVDEAQLPLPEDTPLGGHGAPYDTSKACMELAVRTMVASYPDELPRVGVTRGANFFGPGDTASRRVIPTFIEKGLSTGRIPLTTRRNGRQFIPVIDGVTGYVLAAARLSNLPVVLDDLCRPAVTTFHFALERYPGTDSPYMRIDDLAQLVATITGARVEEQPNCVDYMPHENPVQALSTAATRRALGWEPAQDFAEALADLVDFMRHTKSHRERARQTHEAVETAAKRLTSHIEAAELVAS
jgi:CDP-glucose 4,6-dehydratase